MNLRAEFGDIDIYLFDQLLKGNIHHGMTVLDAGCGGGRNLVYLLRHGFDVCAVDTHPAAAAHFDQMLDEMCRVLKPGGMLFARLASSIGIESLIQSTGIGGNGWFALPDGSERFLVNEAKLNAAAERLRATPLEPLKTTNVANLRCMTTWVLGKTTAAISRKYQ